MPAQKEQSKKSETAPSYDVRKVANVSPPIISRRVGTSVPVELLDAMAQGIEGNWRTNGVVYPNRKEASNAAGLFRRHMIARLNLGKKAIRSKVWERNEGTDPEAGEWIFGLRRREQ